MANCSLADPLSQRVLKLVVPKLLLEHIGLERIQQNTPAKYLLAMVAMWLASRYIYSYGIHACEFSFYQFMQNFEHVDFSDPSSVYAKANGLPTATSDADAATANAQLRRQLTPKKGERRSVLAAE